MMFFHISFSYRLENIKIGEKFEFIYSSSFSVGYKKTKDKQF